MKTCMSFRAWCRTSKWPDQTGTSATGTLNSDIADHRGTLMKRYGLMGEPYGDEVDGLSKVVMSDVSDTTSNGSCPS